MIDRTDEETGELVRAWLQRYGLSIIVGIVLAIVLIGGYEWWQNRQIHTAGETSTQLMALDDAISAGDIARAESLYAEIEGSSLKSLAALLLATGYQSDDQKDQDKSLFYFKEAAKSHDALVAQTANWQLAQTYLAAEDYAAAEKSIQALKGSAYEQQIPLLRGVMAQNQGNRQAALDAYKQALNMNSNQTGFIQAQVAAIEGEIAVDSPVQE